MKRNINGKPALKKRILVLVAGYRRGVLVSEGKFPPFSREENGVAEVDIASDFGRNYESLQDLVTDVAAVVDLVVFLVAVS